MRLRKINKGEGFISYLIINKKNLMDAIKFVHEAPLSNHVRCKSYVNP